MKHRQTRVRIIISAFTSFCVLLLPTVTAAASSANSGYSDMYDIAFGKKQYKSTRLISPIDTAPRTGDDGLIVARFYIPNKVAGARTLRGDNRGPSADPNASSRVTIVWDVTRGWLQLVAHGTVLNDKVGIPIGGQPWREYPSAESALDHTDGWPKGHNAYHVAMSKSGKTAWVEVSTTAVNSATGKLPLGAWSVNGIIRIGRNAEGGYSVRWHGTGYPAQEFYYYPRTGPNVAHILALRDIDPEALRGPDSWFEPSGGAAAAIMTHWTYCIMPNKYSMSCSDDLRNCHEWVTSWDPRGAVVRNSYNNSLPHPIPSSQITPIIPGGEPTHITVTASPSPGPEPLPVSSYPREGCVGTLRSVNYPQYRVQLLPDKTSPLRRPSDAPSWASFRIRMVPGLINSNEVSFESMAYPGYYLRHENGALELQPFQNDELYAKDATFKVMKSEMSSPESRKVSFRSWNFPDRYIRHFNGQLEVSSERDRPGTPFVADSAFEWQAWT